MNNIDLKFSDKYACLNFVTMSLFDVPYLIVVSSVTYSYVDTSYSILGIISHYDYNIIKNHFFSTVFTVLTMTGMRTKTIAYTTIHSKQTGWYERYAFRQYPQTPEHTRTTINRPCTDKGRKKKNTLHVNIGE